MANNIDWESELYGTKGGKIQPQSKANPILKGGSDVLRSIGLGFIPNLAGNAMAVAQNSQYTPENPFISPQQGAQQQQGMGIPQALKDTAGAASYLIPETDIIKGGGLVKGILGAGVNNAIRGGIQGGLGAVSQGQNPIQGAEQGAVAGPAIAGAGALATDVLPRYIGLRNYGVAGLKLPEVTKAENATGGDTLQQVRDSILKNVKPFDEHATTQAGNKGYDFFQTTPEGVTSRMRADPNGSVGGMDTGNMRGSLLQKIEDLSKQPAWDGTPGLSDLKKTSKKAFPVQTGKLADIQKAVQNSDTPFDAYNKLKNMAYSQENTPAGNRLANFMKSAASVAREHLINASDNPDETRKAMDIYAAQTAMHAGNKNPINIGNIGPGAEGALAAIAPFLGIHGLGIPAMADIAITNPLTGPPLARGLVNAGQNAKNSGLASLLQRLGIAGAQNAVNSVGQ